MVAVGAMQWVLLQQACTRRQQLQLAQAASATWSSPLLLQMLLQVLQAPLAAALCRSQQPSGQQLVQQQPAWRMAP
jgi:hypothetical protein